MDRFSKICKDIKEIKIQGAENVAKAALVAYSLKPNASSIKKLISLRKTEPMVVNALNYAKKHSVDETLKLIKENNIHYNIIKEQPSKNNKSFKPLILSIFMPV